MKKILFLFFLCSSIISTAKPIVDDSMRAKWGAVILAIAQVESEGHPNAVSKNGLYVGYLQISKGLVSECNRILKEKRFSFADRYSKEKSIEMFVVFQERYNPEGNMEKAIRLWNSGDLKCMSRKGKTEGYYRRVMRKYSATAKL